MTRRTLILLLTLAAFAALASGPARYWLIPKSDPAIKLFMDFNDGSPSDLSIYGNNGTARSGAAYSSAGVVGGCYRFDATNGLIFTDEDITAGLEEKSFTISAWIKADSDRSNFVVSHKDVTADEVRLTAKSISYDDDSQGTVAASATTDTEDGNWHHLVGTADANDLKIYVDGALEDTGDISGSGSLTLSDVIVIGGRRFRADLNTWKAPGHTTYFDGSIDQVRIYDRALSATEISQMYNAEKPE